jgi:hypothetical protein
MTMSVPHDGERWWQRSTILPGSTAGCANADGEIRKKRSDTLVRTLRKEYGDDFAKGYRSDAQLGTVLEREGVDTLDEFLRKSRP